MLIQVPVWYKIQIIGWTNSSYFPFHYCWQHIYNPCTSLQLTIFWCLSNQQLFLPPLPKNKLKLPLSKKLQLFRRQRLTMYDQKELLSKKNCWYKRLVPWMRPQISRQRNYKVSKSARQTKMTKSTMWQLCKTLPLKPKTLSLTLHRNHQNHLQRTNNLQKTMRQISKKVLSSWLI